MSRKWWQVGIWSLVLALVTMVPSLSPGQVTDSSFTQTESPTPVGSGARAMGTGGAFIAIADDATAANWNPAGTVQLLQPEISVVGTGFQKDGDGELSYSNEINYISLVYPFSVSETNVVVSANYQLMYDFYFRGSSSGINQIDDYTVTVADPSGPPPVVLIDTFTSTYPYDAKTTKDGYLAALSPSVAVQVTPRLAVGLTYNFWSDAWLSNRYEQTYEETRGAGVRTQFGGAYEVPGGIGACTCNGGGPCAAWGDVIDDPACLGGTSVIPGSTATLPPTPTSGVQVKGKEEIEMEGQNFNLGILWEPDPQWTIGAMYRSEVDLDLQRDVTYKSTGWPTLKFSYDEKLRLPAAYGVGVAYRYSDEFTVAFDATRTEYNRARIELDDGRGISPINGLPMSEADIDPTETYRLGSERLVVQPRYVVALRSGVFYDPEPAQGHKDDYYGAAVGAGLVYEPVVIDLAYWYRWGDDVVLYTEYDAGSGDYNEVKGDITEQMLMLSVVTHF